MIFMHSLHECSPITNALVAKLESGVCHCSQIHLHLLSYSVPSTKCICTVSPPITLLSVHCTSTTQTPKPPDRPDECTQAGTQCPIRNSRRSVPLSLCVLRFRGRHYISSEEKKEEEEEEVKTHTHTHMYTVREQVEESKSTNPERERDAGSLFGFNEPSQGRATGSSSATAACFSATTVYLSLRSL